MLQSISNSEDLTTVHLRSSSVSSVSAALNDGKKHLLLAASGSVATIKIPEIIKALGAYPSSKLSIRVILTHNARNFLANQSREQPSVHSLRALPNVDAVYEDADEWREPWRRNKGILHIELRRWADLLCIAPLSANTLGKITNGLCDNLLCSVVRAWDTEGSIDGKKKRILAAPAMNTAMMRHPITARQLRTLDEDWGVKNGGWFEVLGSTEKALACGDVGDGAMKEWQEIVEIIKERMGLDEE